MECETLLQYKWRMDLICRRVGQWRQPAPSSSSSRSNTVAAVQHIWTRCCVVRLLDAASKARVQKFAPGHRIQGSDWPIIGNISWLMFVICGTKPNKKKALREPQAMCMHVLLWPVSFKIGRNRKGNQIVRWHVCHTIYCVCWCHVMWWTRSPTNNEGRVRLLCVCVCELRVTVTKWCLHVAPGDVDALHECRGNFFGACRNSLACKR